MVKSIMPPAGELFASLASDTMKPFLEPLFDHIAATPTGKLMMEQPWVKKLGVSGMLLLLSAIVKWHIGDETPLKKFINDVAGDAAPELISRIYRTPRFVGRVGTEALMEIESLDRENLFRWLKELPREERGRFSTKIAGMTPDDLSKISRLADGDRTLWLEL